MILHILPVNDLEEHQELSTCKCNPQAEFHDGNTIINKCVTTVQHLEVNPNTIVANNPKTGFMANFWKLCYKVKSTTYDLTSIE